MPRLARVLFLAALTATATWSLGWWAVPVVGAAWGLWRDPVEPALAAPLAWAALLGWTAAAGPLLPFAGRLGGVLGIPGWLTLLLALLFAAALAWSAATLTGALARRRS